MMDLQPLSLINYTRRISDTIFRTRELHNVWVRAEISDLRSRGHCYMELIEKDEQGVTIAKMRATIWRSAFESIWHEYNAAGVPLPLENGKKVLVYGEANHHPNYGFSFNITAVRPDEDGDLERLRKEILDRLTLEGIINENKSLKLPPDPQKIAIISSPDAAGFGDFIDQLTNNSDRFVFYPRLFPAVMQGDKTAPSVLEAFDRIEESVNLWDCVVIIRGGGATTDMNGFDNLDLARRVATFPLPVIVGIGHERDRNVLDEIAAVRCKTPTAVAAFLIDSLRNAWSITSQTVTNIVREVQARLEMDKRRVAQLEISIPSLVGRQVDTEKMRIENMMKSLPVFVERKTAAEHEKIRSFGASLSTLAASQIMRASDNLSNLSLSLKDASARRIAESNEKLRSLSELISALSPMNTLKRGYSITRINGKAVKTSDQIKEGDVVETTTSSFSFTSKILKK